MGDMVVGWKNSASTEGVDEMIHGFTVGRCTSTVQSARVKVEQVEIAVFPPLTFSFSISTLTY